MLTLELIAQVAEQGGDKEFDKLTKHLLSLFAIDGDLLETRGDSIIRELCVHLGPEQVFCTMARILEQDKVTLFVGLKDGANTHQQRIFFFLCRIWTLQT